MALTETLRVEYAGSGVQFTAVIPNFTNADVYVPKIVGPMLGIQPLLGRGIRDFVNRKLGAYDTFLTADPAARAVYDNRIADN